MKNILVSTLVALMLSCVTIGCKTDESACKDNKPVAPEHYSDKHGNAADPVLPRMELWWNQ